jgi:hypothetical protein
LLVFLGLPASAAEFVFEDIRWPRHSPRTGLLEWEFRARRAEPRSRTRYVCVQLEAREFDLVETAGGPRIRAVMAIEANRGEYVHNKLRPHALLAGGVTIQLLGRETTTARLDHAKLSTDWNAEQRRRRYNLVADCPVELQVWRPGDRTPIREVTGEGLTVVRENVYREPSDEPESGKGGSKRESETTRSVMQLARKVEMKIRDAGRGPFGGFSLPRVGGPGRARRGSDEVLVITGTGPLTIDELADTATLSGSVVVTRGATRMWCEKLALTFTEVREKAADSGKARRAVRITRMVATGAVRIAAGGQEFRGDVLRWEPDQAMGWLTGSPAIVTGRGLVGRAKTMTFDQKQDQITFVGDATADIDLGAP